MHRHTKSGHHVSTYSDDDLLWANYTTAHQWYGEYLIRVARLDEALQEFKRAQELDPTSLIINSLLGQALYLLRRYDEAIDQLQKTLEIDSNFAITHWMLGLPE